MIEAAPSRSEDTGWLQAALGGTLALALAMGIGRFAYTPLLPMMQAAADLDDGAAGLIASVNFLGYFLGALLTGGVAGRPWCLAAFRVSLAGSVATTLAMAAGDGFLFWLTIRFLSGVASAGVLVLGSAMVLARLAAAGQGALSGLLFAGIGVGIAFSGALVMVLPHVGNDWRLGWLVLGGVAAALAIPGWRWVAEAPAARLGSAGPAAAAAVPTPSAGRRTVLLALMAAYFLEGAGYVVTATFLVSALARDSGLAGISAAAWILVGLSAAPSAVLWVALGERRGALSALVVAHFVQAVAIALPALMPSVATAILGAVLFGGTMLGIVALTLSFGRRLAGGDRRTVGTLTASFAVGQILGPWPAGAVGAATGSFDLALLAAAVAVAAGGGLLAMAGAMVRRRRSRRR